MNYRTAPEHDRSGPVTLHRNENGTLAVVGPVPFVVEMSREMFMDWLLEINEHRREQVKLA